MMKKIFTLMLIGSATFASAQKVALSPEKVSRFAPSISRNDTADIPTPAAACLPNAVIGVIGSSGGGYISGTNGYGDKEKAQYFNYTGGGTISTVLVYFGAKHASTGTATYTVKLYPATGSGSAPSGAALGTSLPVAFSAVDTSGNATSFTFASPVSVGADFFASVVVDAADSVGIYSIFDGSNPANACGNNTAWEQWSDNSWHAFSDASGWGIDLELVMGPIMNTATGVNEVSALTTHKVYPNPAAEMLNFSYQLNAATDVKLNLVDVTGKIVYSKKLSAQTFGAYNESVDVSSFAPGIYTYSIQTNGYTTTGKVMVK